MHCLPVRRNVVVKDEVLDGPRSVVVHEARNRMWAQMALLHRLLQALKGKKETTIMKDVGQRPPRRPP